MKLPSLVVLATVCTALPAAAQEDAPLPERSSTRGFGLGVSFTQSRVDGDVTRNGAGADLAATYGVNDNVSLVGRLTYAYRSAHIDAGARYSFGQPASALRPYVELTGTVVGAQESPIDTGTMYEDVAVSRGYGATARAGVEYFLTPKLAIDAGVSYSRGEFTRTRIHDEWVDNSHDFASTRLNIGFTWRP